jgi:hypothetical protein
MGIVAATLLGPLEREKHWDFVRSAAEGWADEHVILADPSGHAWGQEAFWRAKLWHNAIKKAQDEDWIFILDADFVLTFDPHELIDAPSPTCWRFDLYDLWSHTEYRDDPHWCAHTRPRAWLFRAGASPNKPEWQVRGIHVGHCPTNFPSSSHLCARAPGRMAILHLGWMDDEVRKEKYERYKLVWEQLTEHERSHVESILDIEPDLKQLPDEFQQKLWLKL